MSCFLLIVKSLKLRVKKSSFDHLYCSSGFTLIELLVTIAIIGGLIGVASVNFMEGRKSARDQQRVSDLTKIQSALEQFYADTGQYPITCSVLAGPCDIPPSCVIGAPGCGWVWGWLIISNPGAKIFQWPNPNSITYMNPIPKDPSYDNNTCPGYLYSQSSNFREYTIFTKLENSNDRLAKIVKVPPKAPPNGSLTDGGASFTVGGGTCNGTKYDFWVNSP